MDAGHRSAEVARGQEDVDAVVDDDGDSIAHRSGHGSDLGQEGTAVGALGAQLDAGDSAIDGGLDGLEDAAPARAALALVGDEVDGQVRHGPHAGSRPTVSAALMVMAPRSSVSRAYRASRKAGWKEPGPADRASARSAAAL